MQNLYILIEQTADCFKNNKICHNVFYKKFKAFCHAQKPKILDPMNNPRNII